MELAKYRMSNITDNGLNMARKAANGVIKITFTKGVMSAEEHQNDSLTTLQGLTSLNSFVQSDPINYVLPSNNDSNVYVPLRFSNASLSSNNYINTIGIYASDGTNEVLYSVIINDDPELFPAYNGNTPEAVKVNYETQVGRASQVSVQVSPLGMVTEEEYQSGMATKVSFSGGKITTGNGTFVPASIDDISSTIKNTISNGDNFDNYTKNGTYPITNVTIRTIGGSGGLPSLEGFNGDLTVTVKGNEIEQIINAADGNKFYRSLGQFWNEAAKQNDLNALQTSVVANTNSIANVNTALSSVVTYSGGYIFTGNGSFVPAAINDVTNSIAAASTAASSANSSTAQQEVNDIGSVNAALSSKVSFSGGTIFTGNGSFVPAAIGDVINSIAATSSAASSANASTAQQESNDISNVNVAISTKADESELHKNVSDLLSQIASINNGLNGVSPQPLGDSGDFYNLPLGIYFVNGNPANNPYGHACYGTAFSMGGYVQYLDQNGDAFFITPKSGGWLKYTKQSDVVTLQNQMNGVLARQSNLMQQLANIYADGSLNNLSAIVQTGGTINLTMYNTTPSSPISTVTCVYSFLTNSITINGNYTLNPGQFLWIGLEPLFPYFKGWNTAAANIVLNNPVDYFDWDVIGDGKTWNHVELKLRQSMQGWTGYSFNSFTNTIIALSHQ